MGIRSQEKGNPVPIMKKAEKIFTACAGAAIYRRELLEKTGLFDVEHFAYLEDIDIGYRARIQGYENWYEPSAKVYHVGSGTSGSRYNLFKVRYSSRNNIYLFTRICHFYNLSSIFRFYALDFWQTNLLHFKRFQERIRADQKWFSLCMSWR